MSPGLDFTASVLEQHDLDTLPPTYDLSPASTPIYDGPPSYKDAISDEDGEPIHIARRFFPTPCHVQLSPLEVSFLRTGAQLPFMVGIPNVDMEGSGLRAALKWILYNYICVTLVEVTNDNVDDYGRWVYGSKPKIEKDGILYGRKHFIIGGWMFRRKTPAC